MVKRMLLLYGMKDMHITRHLCNTISSAHTVFLLFFCVTSLPRESKTQMYEESCTSWLSRTGLNLLLSAIT
ncbi:hypothetical protein SCHPADRAFT_735122 [Schizopora paradoxa]|uniref:Uncharacterized protein n=1 Tax=Schizopora paradoxa TaxID=27342 RepID=A0A0H2RK52_9AGAM|nr:hypothetical protein SCHPADRAFT_735122 [Schizopora paradoxa]